MHPALFYLPGERLTLTELGAARLDGHVVEVGEGYMPADTVESSAARAHSIAELVPPHTAASGPSAAWIHGAGDRPPAVHHVTRTDSTRRRVTVPGRVVHHEHILRADEVERIGGVCVSTPLATAVDLLFGAARDPHDEFWLRDLVAHMPALAGELRGHLTPFPRRPGSRLAGRLLAQLAPLRTS